MVKYPAGSSPRLKKQTRRQVSENTIQYASRGMTFEDRLNQSNDYYRTHQKAVIYKKPTPIQVVKVDFPKRSAARITEAYYRHASTTDYNGVYRGYYIDFEAKETTNLTRFPLANLPEHQIQHMAECQAQHGIVFLLISFKKRQEIFLLPFTALENWLHTAQQKSIPYDYILQNGIVCSQGIFPPVDYLSAVDQLINQQQTHTTFKQ